MNPDEKPFDAEGDTEEYPPDWSLPTAGDEDEADTTALHESELAAKENADGEPALATPAHQ